MRFCFDKIKDPVLEDLYSEFNYNLLTKKKKKKKLMLDELGENLVEKADHFDPVIGTVSSVIS